jgi:hypothetical protein
MIILFPKRKGVKIATTIIFKEILSGKGQCYIQGMIDFAFAFGAITKEERKGLIEHLDERERIDASIRVRAEISKL